MDWRNRKKALACACRSERWLNSRRWAVLFRAKKRGFWPCREALRATAFAAGLCAFAAGAFGALAAWTLFAGFAAFTLLSLALLRLAVLTFSGRLTFAVLALAFALIFSGSLAIGALAFGTEAIAAAAAAAEFAVAIIAAAWMLRLMLLLGLLGARKLDVGLIGRFAGFSLAALL